MNARRGSIQRVRLTRTQRTTSRHLLSGPPSRRLEARLATATNQGRASSRRDRDSRLGSRISGLRPPSYGNCRACSFQSWAAEPPVAWESVLGSRRLRLGPYNLIARLAQRLPSSAPDLGRHKAETT